MPPEANSPDVGTPKGSPTSPSSPSAPAAGDNVKVISRIRPFNRREYQLQDEMNATRDAWEQQPLRSVCEMTPTSTKFLDHNNKYKMKEEFKFDYNFWSVPEDQQECGEGVVFATQETVYEKVGMFTINTSFQGYNTCLFAYGQTGSGKTHTMMGIPDDKGLIPRMCLGLFKDIQDKMASGCKESGLPASMEVTSVVWNVEAQYLEIYNERVKDLLWQLVDPSVWEQYDKANLKVRVIPGQGPVVVGLTSMPVKSWEECDDIINAGMGNRATAATKMNDTSSRSHAVFRLTVKQVTTLKPMKQFEKPKTFERCAQINLVDLAGSERLKKTGAVGQRLKEAAAINLSLTTLKNVIDALVEQRQVIPYRDSQLTWLLSDSIGGNSRTFMIACLSPHYDNADETLNTLRYALRTQGVVNHARVNESNEAKKIAALQKQLLDAQKAIQSGGEGTRAQLKNHIEEKQHRLQELVDNQQAHKVLEQRLIYDIEEENKRLIRAVYANQFRVILLQKLRIKLASISEEWARQISLVNDTTKECRNEVLNVAKQLKEVRIKEDKAKMDLAQMEREKDKLIEHQGDVLKSTEEINADRATIEAAMKRLHTRTLITKLICASLLFQQKQRLMSKIDAIRENYSKKLHAASVESKVQRVSILEKHQSELNEFQEDLNGIQKEIESVRNQICAVNDDRKLRVCRISEDITFYERENRNLDDERVQQMTELESQSSKKYNMASDKLSENSMKGRQAMEQQHHTVMHDLEYQIEMVGAERQKVIDAVNAQWSSRLKFVLSESDRAILDRGGQQAEQLKKHDAQIEDVRSFIRKWETKSQKYQRVYVEVLDHCRQHNVKDAELRDLLQKMSMNIHPPRKGETDSGAEDTGPQSWGSPPIEEGNRKVAASLPKAIPAPSLKPLSPMKRSKIGSRCTHALIQKIPSG